VHADVVPAQDVHGDAYACGPGAALDADHHARVGAAAEARPGGAIRLAAIERESSTQASRRADGNEPPF
jgi:hypothetical protein